MIGFYRKTAVRVSRAHWVGYWSGARSLLRNICYDQVKEAGK